MNIETLEQFLQSKIFPDLEKGDPRRDLPHTISIVKKIKDIVENSKDLDLNFNILLISAYCHDWGYSPFFKPNGESMTPEEYSEAKLHHMEIGAKMTEELLADKFFDFLSKSEKERIIHLVLVHDNVEDLVDVDELILMEADTLAGLDTDYMKPTFPRDANKKYIEVGVKGKRFPKFITNYSKKVFDMYLEKRNKYYEEHPEL